VEQFRDVFAMFLMFIIDIMFHLSGRTLYMHFVKITEGKNEDLLFLSDMI